MSGELTAEAILAADDLPSERVEVPEWGGHLHVRTMTGGERDLWEQYMWAAATKAEVERRRHTIRASLVAYTATDKSGKRLFSEKQIEELSGKSAAALSRVYEVAARLNRVTADDLDELEKNS